MKQRTLKILFANCSSPAPVEVSLPVPTRLPMYVAFNRLIGARVGECLSVGVDGVSADVWFDEEGRLTDQPKQVNRVASILAGTEIIGDAIIVGIAYETGETVDLKGEEIQRIGEWLRRFEGMDGSW